MAQDSAKVLGMGTIVAIMLGVGVALGLVLGLVGGMVGLPPGVLGAGVGAGIGVVGAALLSRRKAALARRQGS